MGYNFKEDTAKKKLPADVEKAFIKLGNDQRALPETAMLKVQTAMGGGVLNPVVEHVGDLTHRMSHMAAYHDAGQEYVVDKCEKVLRYLNRPYGFEKEYKENVVTNSKHRKLEPEAYQLRIDQALTNYANEHSKLVVYNRAQWLAREAAIEVGKQNWDMARMRLTSLLMLADKPSWEEEAFKFTKDSAGKLIPYKGTK